MLVGYLFNSKKYSQGQVLAVAMLTLGVIAAALADAHEKGQSIKIESERSDQTLTNTLIGFTILTLAMVLSAFQGVFADRLYEKYGRSHWKEALFYSHTLSLPLFIPTYPHLQVQWRELFSAPSLLPRITAIARSDVLDSTLSQKLRSIAAAETSLPETRSRLLVALEVSSLAQSTVDFIPMPVVYLIMNAFTQYLCIRGVHFLSAKSSSLTVTIVLNIRKLLSLILSIYLFGNRLAPGVLIGGLFVFSGGALYGFEGARLKRNGTKTN
ncbi:putative UPD-GlcNAc transporter (Mnn2-2) [Aspergillus tanneri]|uniref:Golgi uridine diphosphate-N-acetylglucosamine transporter n=1 Tax=Aspergillus tanneri TaxID=1220188 RepID=A0A5M9MQM8_9EURO|nr:golgi uridine diphosphate-N- acetylglucosamine transporter [Aspergillus tanneri]KAA8644877.1 golgi uridine diphosphate-N- acetylglucosamine transporter [Aspergillus tanneri]